MDRFNLVELYYEMNLKNDNKKQKLSIDWQYLSLKEFIVMTQVILLNKCNDESWQSQLIPIISYYDDYQEEHNSQFLTFFIFIMFLLFIKEEKENNIWIRQIKEKKEEKVWANAMK